MALPDICFGKGLAVEFRPQRCRLPYVPLCNVCETFKNFRHPGGAHPRCGPGSELCALCGRRYRRNPATCRRPAFVKLSGLSPEEDGSVPSAAKQSVGRFRLSADICPEDPISPSAFGSLFQ